MIGYQIIKIAKYYMICFITLSMNNKIVLLLCLLMVSAPIAGCVGGNDDTTSDSDEQLDDWMQQHLQTCRSVTIRWKTLLCRPRI